MRERYWGVSLAELGRELRYRFTQPSLDAPYPWKSAVFIAQYPKVPMQECHPGWIQFASHLELARIRVSWLRPPKNFTHSSLRPTNNFTHSSLRPWKNDLSSLSSWKHTAVLQPDEDYPDKKSFIKQLSSHAGVLLICFNECDWVHFVFVGNLLRL